MTTVFTMNAWCWKIQWLQAKFDATALTSAKGLMVFTYHCFNTISAKDEHWRDFPGGPVAGSPPCNAGDVCFIHGEETGTPYAMGQLSLSAETTEARHHNQWAHVSQWSSRGLQPGPDTAK